MKEDIPDEYHGLFGTGLLPKKSITRRYAAARAGKYTLIAIALVCGLILTTLVYRIVDEARVPADEIEVVGIDLPQKEKSTTQVSWKVATYDPDWTENDVEYGRNNVTLTAVWEETHFEAVNKEGEIFTLDGQSDWDLEEDLVRDMCDNDASHVTYMPKETFRLGSLFSGRDYVTYSPGETTRITVFNRSVAPTPSIGEYWIDSDTNEPYVWKGLRWEDASNDPFILAIKEHYRDTPDVFSDGKIWVHMSPDEPIVKGSGDIWMNRNVDDDGTLIPATFAKQYNRTARTWENLSINDLAEEITNPQDHIEAFTPEFCTRAETASFILANGYTGKASISEESHPDGFEPRQLESKQRTADLQITLTDEGGRSLYSYLVVNETTDQAEFSPNYIELRPSASASTNWLFIEHRLNYTVMISQVSGPSDDARDSSYAEIGDFALGTFDQILRFRGISNDDLSTDLDKDGIVDACDDDIDGDNDENPIYGHPVYCPGEGIYSIPEVHTFQSWVESNDNNGDGIHDDVNDRDIDGDGITNLVDGQGFSQSADYYFQERVDYVTDVPELGDLAATLLEKKCSETYKSNDPTFAEFDCYQAELLLNSSSVLYEDGQLSKDEWCSTLRVLDQPNWFYMCGAAENTESGLESYQERGVLIPLLSLISLGVIFVFVYEPKLILMRIRKFFFAVGVEDNPDAQGVDLWSYLSMTKELANSFLRLVLTSLFFIIGLTLFIQTFTTELTLIKPFTFVLGGAIILLGGISTYTSLEKLVKTRPEKGVPPAEGLADGLILLLDIITVIIAINWLIIQGWLVGVVALLFIKSAIKKLILAGLSLTRTNQVKTDRLRLIVKGRDGWILAASVVLIVGLFTVPLAINLPFVFNDFPSSEPFKAGLRAAFWGSVYVVGYTMIFAIPLSVGAAIWLEEYAAKTRLRQMIQALITNLAGVPAIVFGLFGLALFLTDRGAGLGLGATVMTAGMTMATMAMPTIVISSQEALRAVPPSLRNAAFGLGCTKWQVTQHHVLPHAMPGMMTGTILAMSRIMGEAAPLILVGAVASVFTEPDAFFYVNYQFVPNIDSLLAFIPGAESQIANLPLWSDRGLFSADPTQFTGPDSNDRGRYTVLPVQVYVWTGLPQTGFKVIAAGASIVLLGTLLLVNSTAILLRAHFRRYSKT